MRNSTSLSTSLSTLAYILTPPDLSWNNIGLLGGRELADMLSVNHTLTSLRLDGNHISDDVLEAIEAKVERNMLQAMEHERDRAKTLYLSHEMEAIAQATQARIESVQATCEERARHAERDSEACKIEGDELRKALVHEQGVVKTLETRLYASQQDHRAMELDLKAMGTNG